MRGTIAAFALANLLAAPATAAPLCIPPVGTLVYQVLNDGEPVGEVRIAVKGAGDSRHVRSSVDVELSMLAVIDLRYRHRSEELWRDGAFHSFRGQTRNVGKRYEVVIAATGDDVRMTRNGKAKPAGGALMSWAVWCEAALSEARLVDPLKGKLKGIEVTFLGTPEIEVGGRTVASRHYRVRRKDTKGEIWYGPDGIVVKASFPTAIGTRGTAVLVENTAVAQRRN